MIPIHTVFGGLVLLFALVGSLRGWAKEVIAAFSVLVALFFEHVLMTFITPLRILFQNMAPQSQFYTRAIIFVLITIFGYATPTIAMKLGARVARERLQDILLGFFIGALNGFLIIGTLFSFLDTAYYGIPADMRSEQTVTDSTTGQPVFGPDGVPLTQTVYHPDAKGIGGIVPPPPNSTAHNLLAFLPPKLVARSNAILYLAVAAAFVFVVVVFI